MQFNYLWQTSFCRFKNSQGTQAAVSNLITLWYLVMWSRDASIPLGSFVKTNETPVTIGVLSVCFQNHAPALQVSLYELRLAHVPLPVALCD